MTKPIDFSQAWKDANILWRANLDMALAVGGVFFLLPALVIGWFGTAMNAQSAQSITELSQLVSAWLDANWYLLLFNFILSLIGTMSLYLLVLNPARPTVGETLIAALALLPFFFVLQLVTGIVTGLGFIALVIPGIYLTVKFMFGGPVMAAEGIRDPIAAMRRSWGLTKSNSVMIFLFMLMIFFATLIGMMAIELAINIPLTLWLGDQAKPVNLLVSSTLQVIVSLFFMFIVMAIYRQLAANHAAA